MARLGKMALPVALVEFRIKYGFWPKRELARVYWNKSIELQSRGDYLQSMIAVSHAMRLWPEIINCR